LNFQIYPNLLFFIIALFRLVRPPHNTPKNNRFLKIRDYWQFFRTIMWEKADCQRFPEENLMISQFFK
jgi:hypothetical protein